MIFYFYFTLTTLLFFLISRVNNSSFFLNLTFIFIFIVSAFRFDVGFDYPTYFDLAVKKGNFVWQFIRLEPLSQFIVFLVWQLNSPSWIFIIYCFFSLFLLRKVISKLSIDADLSLLVYILFPLFFLDSLSLIRQHLAMSIVVYSYQFVFKSKLFKFLLCVFLASLIHYYAFFAVILYFLNKIDPKLVLSLVCIIVSIFIGNFGMSFLLNLLPFSSSYLSLDEVKGEGGNIMKILVNLIAFAIIFIKLYFTSQKSNFKDEAFFLNSFFLGVILYNILSPFGHAGLRMFEYFGISLIFIIPLLKRFFIPDKIYLTGVSLIFSLLFLAYINFSTSNQKKSPFTPYQNILFLDYTDFKKLM